MLNGFQVLAWVRSNVTVSGLICEFDGVTTTLTRYTPELTLVTVVQRVYARGAVLELTHALPGDNESNGSAFSRLPSVDITACWYIVASAVVAVRVARSIRGASVNAVRQRTTMATMISTRLKPAAGRKGQSLHGRILTCPALDIVIWRVYPPAPMVTVSGDEAMPEGKMSTGVTEKVSVVNL